MSTAFTAEIVQKAMEQCAWYPRNQFVLAADLKPKVLANALANIAPELRKEDVLAVRDDTFLRSGKCGWILTADRIYFHKDYQFFNNPHIHYVEFSNVKQIAHRDSHKYIVLTFRDDTSDRLDCQLESYAAQIYEFLACIIHLHEAGYGDGMFSMRKDVLHLLYDHSLERIQKIFPKYPTFVMLKDLPAKQVTLLKKHLENPFLEQIVAFDGNIDNNVAYGHLFTVQYYYFLSGGKLADKVSMWELEDIYPHHSSEEMTAIMKDGTVRALKVGSGNQDDLEAIFEEINISHLPNSDVRRLHLNESEEEQARRARVIRKMSEVRRYLSPRVYENSPYSLKDLRQKLEAAGDLEGLPYIYEHSGYHASPPGDSYFYAKSYLHMPLSRVSLSYAYYYLFALKHNVRFCDDKIRRYEDLDYRAFIRMCNQTPLTEVREKLLRELNTYRYRFE